MQLFIRTSTLVIAIGVALLSCAIAGVAIAGDTGVSQIEMVQTTFLNVEQAIEFAAARSGYHDSELHLAASIPFGAIGAQLAYSTLPAKTHRWSPLVLGLTFGIAPGMAKEIFDATQTNNYFSSKDLAYDMLGASIGLGITCLVHFAVKRLQKPAARATRKVQDFGARVTGQSYLHISTQHPPGRTTNY